MVAVVCRFEFWSRIAKRKILWVWKRWNPQFYSNMENTITIMLLSLCLWKTTKIWMFAQNKETVWGQFIAPGGFDHHELSNTWRKMLEMLRKMTTDSLIFIKNSRDHQLQMIQPKTNIIFGSTQILGEPKWPNRPKIWNKVGKSWNRPKINSISIIFYVNILQC